ncbi:serine hydrolase domain-containing protein [Streptomyces sp. NPDC047081]|uniref:serine hydrolase domain-containing protein n=1 Tax=Streptomyces sp. NPDC047081 TaxID=3154706 RepID=UPI0034008379
MSDHSRSLPDHPSLRYLKIEAKRRLRTGEFGSLDEAQLAIAREHGHPSWAALKRVVESTNPPQRHASRQLRWIAARFADAGAPTWHAPSESELREHFHEQLLEAMPPDELLPRLRSLAPRLHRGPVLVEDTATHALARLESEDLGAVAQLQAVVEPVPPHRLVGLRVYPTAKVEDPRLTAPANRTEGRVPAVASELAARAFAELGLPGLALAGADARDGVWALARGWAALEPLVPLTNRHRFPAGSVTTLVTATAVLRLVADGRVGLDDPANRHLSTVRLADSAVTVRELLSHTGGVVMPDRPPTDREADSVPDPRDLFGPVIPCAGQRGRHVHSDWGYVALGLLVENLTGSPCPQAVADLVLRPLGMDDSFVPTERPSAFGAEAVVTGYVASGDDGSLRSWPERVSTVPAASGLWTTASDLARFGLGWHALLPDELARQALTPQADLPGGSHAGLGWLLDRTGDIAGHEGHLPGASASLVLRVRDRRVHVALANRSVPVEPVNGRILRALG